MKQHLKKYIISYCPDAIFYDIWFTAHLLYYSAVNPKKLSDVTLHSENKPSISRFSERTKWLSKALPI